MVTLEELLQILVQRNGSDLHITAGSPPKIRIDGRLVNTEHDVLSPEMSQKIVYSVLDSNQIARFEKDLELDMSFGIEGLGRFRTNVLQQRGAVGAVFRIIPYRLWVRRGCNGGTGRAERSESRGIPTAPLNI